jgi:nickel-dependent lactate racemase
MATIRLNYGKDSLPFDYEENRFHLLGAPPDGPRLSDADIGERLDQPLDSLPLEELIQGGRSVLIVVPDATRQSAAGQVVNLLVRRLIANGTPAHDIRIIFATGIHRRVTSDERSAILTPFITQRIKTLDHDPRDLMQLVRVGETAGGVPVELNRALLEHDHVIIIGGVTFHYFAGFTGGRKLICPGLASSRTIAETHKLAFDCDTRNRRKGVGTGLLDGNGVHEAFVDAASYARPTFAVNTIVDSAGNAVDLYCGDWISSHRAACDAYLQKHTVSIRERREAVVVSCGGYPFDINMIQAHKSLEAASKACVDGGTIIMLAKCEDGLGRDDFLKWFDAADSSDLAMRLCEKYQVNGQTAWSLWKKAERFNIRIMTSLPDDVVKKLRLTPTDDLTFAKKEGPAGYIIPHGASISIDCRS